MAQPQRMSTELLLANVTLLFLTIGGNFVLIPLHASLICTAFLIVYLGSHRSLTGASEDGTKKQMEHMERKDALWFPIMAGCTLVGLFVLFKFLPKDLVNLIITVYVSFISVFICANEFFPIVRVLFPSTETVFELKVKIPYIHKLAENPAPSTATTGDATQEKTGETNTDKTEKTSNESPKSWDAGITADDRLYFKLAFASCISLLLGLGVTLWYVWTRHWVANNLIGIAMSLQAMESLSLGSYKTGAVLLSLLFFYDIFFVFGTDVMVTVAKSVDAPIKLLFIKAFAQADADAQFSMLGLGDIVLPGVFVALLLRYDAAKAKLELGTVDHSSTSFPKPIFNITVLFYALGLWATVLVMHIFKHPQPALLYLVPACLIASVLAGILHGRMRDLWEFDETPKKPESAATTTTTSDKKAD
jgi:minor histocompatibility antigen H13